ncbi:uncharacterized protein MONBRDRAFT_27022 [Monosiga brevicollis MX1]|uniref:Inosine/uridine-preferring nucleoside hydrolase domain-containing protein n=1 Tax=Monosiga brevicollis TaxID=81824 RepID=A9V429_MONBE|nr:uncharacterized protein MONBRDRAFT_27022 [Monosiga brevicollis MX1]EDQ87548.1 predicted protein [Monosiga brevicollis MX1]|eukprot:XP_001747468.1 hypothetical protein [Monosiga brevicollis MX1]
MALHQHWSWLLMVGLASSVCWAEPVKVILDTDMSTDCDDVAATCILNQMHADGEVEILAIVHNTGLYQGIGAVSVLNTFYNHSKIPLGAYKGTFDANATGQGGANKTGAYVADLVEHFPSPIKNYDQVPAALSVYRQQLAAAANNSVTIVSIGFMTNLADLINSTADEHSPLSGIELVSAKVKHFAVMGGNYLHYSTHPEWNFGHNNIGVKTKFVIEHWPSHIPITYLGSFVGQEVVTGAAMTNQLPTTNPCRQAYVDFNGPSNGRFSWDPMTTLLAVRGIDQFYDSVRGWNEVLTNGTNVFHNQTGTNQAYVAIKGDPQQIANAIDNLLLKSEAQNAQA